MGLGMDGQVDGLGKIQAENAHDGLCIDNITSGSQIEIVVEPVYQVYKIFDTRNGVETDGEFLHL